MVSVSARSVCDLMKRFDNTSIDWAIIENQLLAWGELHCRGKKLRLNLSFNYMDVIQSSNALAGRFDKRGSSSTTRQMLAEGSAQLDAEQASSGHPSVWREIYSLMCCPGPLCHLGPHCWRDPVGKKHYKLRSYRLKSLITLVQNSYMLKSQDDVPEDIREQLL